MPANRRAIRPGCQRSWVDAVGFKDARRTAGFTRQVAADLLGVSERTVRNWEAKRARVPYSAFKLMRIFSGYELPGEAWRGFRLFGDTLWSPEGKAFAAADLAWWSLTVAMARSFRLLHARGALVSGKPGVTQPPQPQVVAGSQPRRESEAVAVAPRYEVLGGGKRLDVLVTRQVSPDSRIPDTPLVDHKVLVHQGVSYYSHENNCSTPAEVCND